MSEARPSAKVNLTLEVGVRREDGYHALRSVFLRIGLADSLAVAQADAGERDSLTITGLPGCPVEGNLVLRAFELLRGSVAPGLPGLAATLDKQIPLGAGLGGGSSDGAAALELAAAEWGIGQPPAQRAELALALGSDVPFFASGAAAALVDGRGDKVRTLPAPTGEVGLLLAISDTALSTADVFARHDDLAAETPAKRPTDALAAAFERGLSGPDLADLAEGLRDANDLWQAAVSLAPELEARRSVLENATARPWLMTGSGATLFALFGSLADAVEAGQALDAGRPAALTSVMLLVTDLDHPDPAWRQE